jgi:hypothetical protein
MHEKSKQFSVTVPLGAHRLLNGFSQFKHGEVLVEDREHSGHLSTGCTDENVEKLCRSVDED